MRLKRRALRLFSFAVRSSFITQAFRYSSFRWSTNTQFQRSRSLWKERMLISKYKLSTILLFNIAEHVISFVNLHGASIYVYLMITYVFVCIFNPYYIIRKLEGHLCARCSTKKTNYRICNKGWINTLQRGVLDFNPPLSHAFFHSLSFSLFSFNPLPPWIMVRPFHSFTSRLGPFVTDDTNPTTAIQKSSLWFLAWHPPPCSRDPPSTLCGKTLDIVSWISREAVEWRSLSIRARDRWWEILWLFGYSRLFTINRVSPACRCEFVACNRME